MKAIVLFSLFITLLMIQSCKENATTQQEEANTGQRDTTASDRINPVSGGHDFTFLTDQLFHYDAVNIIGKDPADNPYKDQWIDLMPDGTYKSGTLKEQTHTGQWYYNHDQKILQLRPNDAKFKTSEWKVMHNNNMMVWVGTQSYGDNATQIKLERRADLP